MPETYGELKTLCCQLRDELAAAKAEIERDAAINILRARNDVEKKKENEVMGLYEAIEHLDESIPRICVDGCEECAQEHEQLKAWLVELAAFRARQEDKNELLRLRDELMKTRSGRQALRYIEDILTLMKDQGMTWDLARMYVESWTKG